MTRPGNRSADTIRPAWLGPITFKKVRIAVRLETPVQSVDGHATAVRRQLPRYKSRQLCNSAHWVRSRILKALVESPLDRADVGVRFRYNCQRIRARRLELVPKDPERLSEKLMQTFGASTHILLFQLMVDLRRTKRHECENNFICSSSISKMLQPSIAAFANIAGWRRRVSYIC